MCLVEWRSLQRRFVELCSQAGVTNLRLHGAPSGGARRENTSFHITLLYDLIDKI